MRRNFHVEAVAHRFWATMHREVFWRGHYLEIMRVIALKAPDKGYSHAACQVWIFSVGLLPPSPARIAENIDIGRPERQTGKDAVVIMPKSIVVFGPALDCYRISHLRSEERRVGKEGSAR